MVRILNTKIKFVTTHLINYNKKQTNFNFEVKQKAFYIILSSYHQSSNCSTKIYTFIHLYIYPCNIIVTCEIIKVSEKFHQIKYFIILG